MGLNAAWIRKLRQILSALEAAERPEHTNYPGSYFDSLKGGRERRYSVRLMASYRITFGWDEDGAVDVDIDENPPSDNLRSNAAARRATEAEFAELRAQARQLPDGPAT